MGFNMPEEKKFEQIEPGTYMGTCYRIVDLGTQDTTFKGEAKKVRLVTLSWEIPDEKMEDGRPFSVNKRYTFSSNVKSIFRKDLESWRAKKFTDDELRTFEIDKLLGATAMLTIARSEDDKYTNVMGVGQPPKGTPRRTECINESFCFALEPDMFNPKLMEKMHEKTVEAIKKSPEYQALIKGQDPKQAAARQTSMDLDDEIPF